MQSVSSTSLSAVRPLLPTGGSDGTVPCLKICKVSNSTEQATSCGDSSGKSILLCNNCHAVVKDKQAGSSGETRLEMGEDPPSPPPKPSWLKLAIIGFSVVGAIGVGGGVIGGIMGSRSQSVVPESTVIPETTVTTTTETPIGQCFTFDDKCQPHNKCGKEVYYKDSSRDTHTMDLQNNAKAPSFCKETGEYECKKNNDECSDKVTISYTRDDIFVPIN